MLPGHSYHRPAIMTIARPFFYSLVHKTQNQEVEDVIVLFIGNVNDPQT